MLLLVNRILYVVIIFVAMYCVNKYHEDANKCHIHNKQCRYYFLIKHWNSKFHSVIIYHEANNKE